MSEKQRSGLLELMIGPMERLPAMYFEAPDHGGYYQIDMALMMRQTKSIDDDRLAALLDGKQLKRWNEVNPAQLSRSGYVRERIDPGKLPPASEMDEVEVERLLSGFLHREARKMKQKVQAMMQSQVENIVRVSAPAEEAVTMLNTAAKGAAEEMAQGSIGNLTSWVRSQFQNLKPADVPARLQNLYNPYNNDRQVLPEPRLWTAAVERLLSGPQLESWKAEQDARDAWRRRAMVAMVVSELEKRVPIKAERREALEKKLAEVIADYAQELGTYFSGTWYLQGYYTLVPLALFTDAEMAEFFDKQELETVKEKCLANATQYAEMLRRNRANRKK
jgi:hypothetical protein